MYSTLLNKTIGKLGLIQRLYAASIEIQEIITSLPTLKSTYLLKGERKK